MLLTDAITNNSAIQVVAIIISILALILSIITIGINFELHKRLNHTTTKSNIYQNIFNGYLLEHFPSGLNIVLSCKHKNDIRNARKLLNSSIKKCLRAIDFFVIEDTDFHTKIKACLIRVNDLLYGFTSPYNDFDEQKIKLQSELRELYKLIFQKYKNG